MGTWISASALALCAAAVLAPGAEAQVTKPVKATKPLKVKITSPLNGATVTAPPRLALPVILSGALNEPPASVE